MTADEVYVALKWLRDATADAFDRTETATKRGDAELQRRIDAIDDRIDEIRKKVEAM